MNLDKSLTVTWDSVSTSLNENWLSPRICLVEIVNDSLPDPFINYVTKIPRRIIPLCLQLPNMQNISHHSPSLQKDSQRYCRTNKNNLTVQLCACVWSPNEDYLATQQLTLQFLESLDFKKKLNQKDNRKTHTRKQTLSVHFQKVQSHTRLFPVGRTYLRSPRLTCHFSSENTKTVSKPC